MATETSSSPTPLDLTSDITTSQMLDFKTTKPPIKFKTTTHIPLQKYQLTHNLLYERYFFGESYISGHLQRLQSGVFISPNIHPSSAPDEQGVHFSKTYVTFVAIAFTLHPSLSEEHRFQSATVEIRAANQDGSLLRILRFAPHLAFGRISSASLKWNFQLGASLGVAQGPAKADLEPKVGFEKGLVVGSFMRIQGSTRRGLPRGFTFVFLLERPLPKKCTPQTQSAVQKQLPTRPQIEKAATEGEQVLCCGQASAAASAKYERIAGIDVKVEEPETAPATPPRSPPHKRLVKKSPDLVHTFLSKARSKSEEIVECLHSKTTELEKELSRFSKTLQHTYYDDPAPLHVTGNMPNARRVSAISTIDIEKVFTPLHFHIGVKPRITNAPDKSTNLFSSSDYDQSIVEGQVGQRFGAYEEEDEDGEDDDDDESVLVDGLFNFAAMSGHFEDLVELPGSSVGTIEPSLPAK
ncbi:uncharacterized protein RAG0_01299 [Rhynchosporium agropyri]|uniref:Uncharacterized protein n=1 Tax=Rhynchosporium agropyri TaxID=914238 RepID=A0A1E1JWE8_9HELO|nr:uncharacterized protein RAG0_01299 [Rhynchosporium agropyri]